MNNGFSHCLQIFPTININRTAEYYERLGFRAVYYLDSIEPHVCLYRDSIEIILTQSKQDIFVPNRVSHGYGYDAYFIATEQQEIEHEFINLGVKIVRHYQLLIITIMNLYLKTLMVDGLQWVIRYYR